MSDPYEAGQWLRDNRANRTKPVPTVPTGGLVVESLAGVRPQGVDWLWDARIPLGAVTILAGREGGGKSALSLGLAARASRGTLEGSLYGQPVNSVLITFEDAVANTIVPRLLAANADMARVQRIRVEGDVFSLTDHIEDLSDSLRVSHARLLVIDPFVAALAVGQVDSHRAQDVRRALAPLAELAEELSLAVVAVFHLNKSQGTDLLTRVSGSGAFTQFARSVLAFGASPDAEPEDPERVLAHAKCNVGRRQRTLEYRIEPRLVDTDTGKMETNYAHLVGESDAAVSDLLGEATDRGEAAHAWEALQDELADGEWHPSAEVKKRLKAKDVAVRTAQRVAEKYGVEMERRGMPSYSYWRLSRAGGFNGAQPSVPAAAAPPVAPQPCQPLGATTQTPLLKETTTTTTPSSLHTRPTSAPPARRGDAAAPNLGFDLGADDGGGA